MLLKLCPVLLLAVSINAGVLPVEVCKLSDSKCLVSEFQKAIPVFMNGMPDIGVEVLDVMDMEDLEFDLSGLQFTLSDGKLKGLRNSIMDNVVWDTNKKQFEIVYHLDALVKGHYTAGGRILILPITGDGQMKLKLKNMEVKILINYDMETKDGKDYVVPKKYNVSFDVRDNAQFLLTNLFNGNKELSDTMLNFLNQNWKQISIEFGKPMIENAAKTLFKNMKIFFKNVPLSDIAEY